MSKGKNILRINNPNDMTMTISKQFTFAAAHKLPNYNGLCNNLHGHEWKLEVGIKNVIDESTGMVLDFKILKQIVKETIIDELDHAYINDIIYNPTAENILVWIENKLMVTHQLNECLSYLKLWETPDSCAELITCR